METPASLLERLRIAPEEADWERLDHLYRPLIHRWLLQDPTLGDEAEDLVQEIMTVLIDELPSFERQRLGSFRCWLRTVTVHRLSAYQRERKKHPRAVGGPLAESPLEQLADPHSELSRFWDEEHDAYVLRRLMELIEPQFEAATLAAFRRVVLDGAAPTQAAAELGLTLNAVLLAKSRVLSRLRREAEGFID